MEKYKKKKAKKDKERKTITEKDNKNLNEIDNNSLGIDNNSLRMDLIDKETSEAVKVNDNEAEGGSSDFYSKYPSLKPAQIDDIIDIFLSFFWKHLNFNS